MKHCIIIGSGILGAMTAYRLAKNNVKVTLIDEPIEGKATSAAAGIICPWLTKRRNKAWYHLAKEGARLYPKLVQELNNDGESNTGYARVGALILQNNRDKLMDTYDRGMNRMSEAPEIEKLTFLTKNETRTMLPLIHEDYEAIHVKGAARVDGQLICQALINGAKKYGADLKYGKATILHNDNKVTGASLNGEDIESDAIVCTTGAWMKETLQPLGINFKARPQRGQILHFSPPKTKLKKWPVIMPPNNLSIVPFSDRLVIGSTHENNAGFEPHLTAGGMHEILTRALDIIPGLANWSLLETRVGFRPFTPDSLPIIGVLPGFQNLFVGNGLGSSGLTTGPYVGEQLAKLVLDQELDINLANFDIKAAIES